jgi:hypothetical protein
MMETSTRLPSIRVCTAEVGRRLPVVPVGVFRVRKSDVPPRLSRSASDPSPGRGQADG